MNRRPPPAHLCSWERQPAWATGSLIKRILAGDRAAGEQLVREHDEKFRGFEGVDLKPQGPPVVLNSYAFLYYLGGSNTAARRVEVMVPESRPRPKR